MDVLAIDGFDWDAGNWPICGKHGVSRDEIEDCFTRSVMVAPDPYPVTVERRFNAVGSNRDGRKVFIVFTLRQTSRGRLIRPISARYMHRREVQRYEQSQKQP